MVSPPLIDLHTHSTASDGTDTPEQLVAAAHRAGVDVLAITDHDTTGGWDEAAAALPTGMRLVRAWNGCTHVVTIGEDKVIRWNDREWRSLSEVARAITGTRWSGAAFFVLKQKAAA